MSTRVVFAGSAGSSEPTRGGIVVVELEKELVPREIEAAEIVLAMRVVIGVERVERCDLSDRHRAHVARQGVDARRQHRPAECRIEGLPKRVVEIANAFASLFVSERHVLLHAIDASSWRAERQGGTLSIIILGVVVGAVSGVGRGIVVFEGVDKLGEVLRRKSEPLVRWIGGGSGCLGGLVFGVGCHADIIPPDRRACVRLSHSWSLMGQSGSSLFSRSGLRRSDLPYLFVHAYVVAPV